jgi:hypothetical protein
VHLVVDQHTGGFGGFEIPNLIDRGELALLNISLGAVQDDVPMGWHPALRPPEVPGSFAPATPSVEQGAGRIVELVRAHADAPSAAAQMSRVLDQLLEPWIKPLHGVTATVLMGTTLARELVGAMVKDAESAVAHYNHAVAQVPEAGIGPLNTGPGAVELPLWRIDGDGRRQRAFLADARQWLDEPAAFALLPRALTMTALMRLGMCDVFIHGFGGAQYDPAMEKWLASWLSAAPQPIVMVSATMRLPLARSGPQPLDVRKREQLLRHLWHDPTVVGESPAPSERKAKWMTTITAAPRNSIERRRLYLAMHEDLAGQRASNAEKLARAEALLEQARQQQREKPIVERRTWPFPLYPTSMIDELVREVSQQVRQGCECSEGAIPARQRAR